MLEQPPEKSEWEVRAAAQAPRPPSYGCFRVILWGIPTYLIGLLAWLTLLSISPMSLSYQRNLVTLGLLGVLIALGIGTFDAFLSRRVMSAPPDKKTLRIVLHVLLFFVLQILINAAVATLLIGACILIFTKAYNK
jgi:hypothetical protein